jgi:hypothetical protein
MPLTDRQKANKRRYNRSEKGRATRRRYCLSVERKTPPAPIYTAPLSLAINNWR